MTATTATRTAADLRVGDQLANGSEVAHLARNTSAGVVHITWTSGHTTAYVRAGQAYRVKV